MTGFYVGAVLIQSHQNNIISLPDDRIEADGHHGDRESVELDRNET